jgi:opacity protein-like surface antigen
MKTKKNILSLVVVLISTTLLLSGAKASDNPKKKTETKTTISLNQINTEYPDLRMVELGVHYMPTFYSMTFKNVNGDKIKGSASFSHGFGGMLALNFSPHVGVQGEIDYYKATQKFSDQSVDNELSIKYIDIPLLLSLNTNKMAAVNLNAVVGPQFGINVGSEMSSSGSTARATVEAKKGDIGAAFGAGLEFALNSSHTVRLDVGYRGFFGFVKTNIKSTGSDTYNFTMDASRKFNAGYVRLTFLL